MKHTLGIREDGTKYEKRIYKLWKDKPKWKRKQVWYALTNDIAKQRMYFKDDRMFSTWDCLESGIKLSWMDFTLPSRKCKDQIYNCMIRTCQLGMHEEINEKLWHDVYEEAKNDPDDIVTWTRKHPYSKYLTMNTEEAKLERFSGRSRLEEHQYRMEQWYKNQKEKGGEYIISPKCTFDTNYRYGIGTYINIDVPVLTLEIVNNWILQFYENGEQPYVLDPVPQDHLIYDVDWMKILETSQSNPLCSCDNHLPYGLKDDD